jgi:hypothetical protein
MSDIHESFNRLAEYANFVSSASLFKQKLEASGLNLVGIPKYSYPEILLAVPEVFDAKPFIRQVLIDSINGKFINLPAHIQIGFTQKLNHPDGTYRSGYDWLAKYQDPESDTLEMLEIELNKQNPIDFLALSWGENPDDPTNEICDLTFWIDDPLTLRSKDFLDDYYLEDNDNNCKIFAQRISELKVNKWIHMIHMYPKSDSSFYTDVALYLQKQLIKAGYPPIINIQISDLFEDTYDKQYGEIILPGQPADASTLITLSQNIKTETAQYRSNTYNT